MASNNTPDPIVNLNRGETETGAAFEIAQHAASRKPVDVFTYDNAAVQRAFVLDDGQHVEFHDNLAEQPYPLRATSKRTTNDRDAFLKYIARHATEATTVWADIDSSSITAIFDDHEPAGADDITGAGIPGWGEHRMTLHLRKTEDWKSWEGSNGAHQTQLDFAEFLENQRHTIIKPAAADMLELAQTFQATTGVDFKSAHRLDNGEIGLTYNESIEGKAGRAGRLEIPQSFTVSVAVYESSFAPVELEARLRWRLRQQQVSFAYIITRLDLVLREAFGAVTDLVEGGLPDTVELFRGRP